jgi:hypothetical protein
MSYEKRTVGANDVITFFYVTDTIFNEVSEVTAFKAASTLKEDGQPDYDRIQISADEKTFMKRFLKDAMLEVFSVMFKIINGGSVVHDTELVLDVAGTVTASHVDITDNEKYREINLDLIDQKINNALIDYILSEWYFMKGLLEDSKLHQAKFMEGLKRISEKTLTLRQPA